MAGNERSSHDNDSGASSSLREEAAGPSAAASQAPPLWIHGAAGSFAGMVEHTALYPLDTVRTHVQVCAPSVGGSCGAASTRGGLMAMATVSESAGTATAAALAAPSRYHQVLNNKRLPSGMWQTIRSLASEPTAAAAIASTTGTNAGGGGGAIAVWMRLWRGVQVPLVGSIPADGLYFASYELVKALTTTCEGPSGSAGTMSVWSSSLAGAAAVLSHDAFMTPLDTLKQRMQLGHYHGSGMLAALQSILHTEGWMALYRSFPITLATNVPYGMAMVTTNETLKRILTEYHQDSSPTTSTIVIASSAGGLVASAMTTPLDRIKTALQTQELKPTYYHHHDTHAAVRHAHWRDAAEYIYRTEGWAGFVRGMLPRILNHTPTVAIGWTTYEATKEYMLRRYYNDYDGSHRHYR